MFLGNLFAQQSAFLDSHGLYYFTWLSLYTSASPALNENSFSNFNCPISKSGSETTSQHSMLTPMSIQVQQGTKHLQDDTVSQAIPTVLQEVEWGLW